MVYNQEKPDTTINRRSTGDGKTTSTILKGFREKIYDS